MDRHGLNDCGIELATSPSTRVFMLRRLCLEQISAINLFLSLEDPLTYFMAAEFEKMEYFFSGILPMTLVGDALILQCLNNTPVDYDKVVACGEMAKVILGYIRENDPYLALPEERRE